MKQKPWIIFLLNETGNNNLIKIKQLLLHFLSSDQFLEIIVD